jgi:hypothetical protein
VAPLGRRQPVDVALDGEQRFDAGHRLGLGGVFLELE